MPYLSASAAGAECGTELAEQIMPRSIHTDTFPPCSPTLGCLRGMHPDISARANKCKYRGWGGYAVLAFACTQL